MNIRTTALSALAATGHDDPRAYPPIFEKFKEALAVENYGSLRQIARAFIRLKDPRAQEAFDMMRERFKGQANTIAILNDFEAQFKAALNR
jgi:hypothetical protein